MVSAKKWKFPSVNQRLGVRMRRAMFALRRLLMSRLRPMGFTHEQYVILLYLGEEDGITQRELSRRSSTNPITITKILNRLETDELVRRVPHESDGRAFRVEITAQGDKLRQKLMTLADDVVEQVLGHLSQADCEMFLRCLDTIASVAEQSMPSDL